MDFVTKILIIVSYLNFYICVNANNILNIAKQLKIVNLFMIKIKKYNQS